tara:strand:+ start:4975 stop:5418 length:444 start_codon:yes stop_codon:yes gene_type:complete
MIRDRRDGMAMGGRTRLPRVDDTKILMEAGGYSGGLAETGRGTMAGELGKKGSMSVREAGEDMYELSKRKRGMQGGGAASKETLKKAMSGAIAGGTAGGKRKPKKMTTEDEDWFDRVVGKIAPLYNQETVTRSQPIKDLRKKIKEKR